MTSPKFMPVADYPRYTPAEMRRHTADFFAEMSQRRTIRHFSNRPVPRDIIETCLRTAGTAPNGANMQPWHFVVISTPAIKHKIRLAAEAEEYEFYEHRAPEDWLHALEPFGTNPDKPFLDTAPHLIAIFGQNYHFDENGQKVKHYYVTESVGIATGILITALHHAGLATLTHTPSPMKFLNSILERPPSEHPLLLLVVGYPAEDATVPVITKKLLEEIATFK